MNYPVWERFWAGGGLVIAVIAVVHVYVAHFAVGGGLFLVLTEMVGLKRQQQDILDYVKQHSKFFMLLTMVFGGLTGVGIWFAISLVSPGTTSTLVHYFVFGWATEWVCFTGEIVALFIYWYRFDKMAPKDHLKIGWLYFIFAWLSLFFVNGIICFMFTPGKWVQTLDFWDGFFNPTTWPSLGFRSFLAFMLAGVFGFVTAVFIKKKALKDFMLKYCAAWVVISFAASLPFLWWYFKALPEASRQMIMGRSPEMVRLVRIFIWTLPALLGGSCFLAVKLPGNYKKTLAFVVLFIGLVYMGAFEWIREGGRRPWLVYGHTWSNAVSAGTEETIAEQGILKTARWVYHKEVTDENQMAAGREIFRLECMGCHSVGGPSNDILPLTRRFSYPGMAAQLAGQGKITSYMPPFFGTDKERFALSAYIVAGLHHKPLQEKPLALEPLSHEVLPFSMEDDTYLLLAASTKGMVESPGENSIFTFRDTGSTVMAHLILRDELPEMVSEDVSLTWELETGQKGEHQSGKMVFSDERMAFVAENLNISPFTTGDKFNPYPLMTLTARAKDDERVLARTTVVVPVTTEIGCRNCHGGPWKNSGRAGVGKETAMDILAVHDRFNKTDLVLQAKKQNPVKCGSCHGDEGKKSQSMTLSAAIHGFHAVYLSKAENPCSMCHSASDEGATRFLRGIHKELAMSCENCHGSMASHATALLKHEARLGRKSANTLMQHIPQPDDPDAVSPRVPWKQQPDCLNCHVGFQPPETDESPLNMWTASEDDLFRSRTGDAGLMCIGCHNSPHAVYPAINPYDEDRDNIPVIQYQGSPYPMGANLNCKVCHTIDMEDAIHHPNMMEMFRNER